MKAGAICFLMLGMIALWFVVFQSGRVREYNEAKTHIVAINYAIYRNAAQNYVHANAQNMKNGEIERITFEKHIPNGWLPMREWKVRIENHVCYVYGSANTDEIDAIRLLYKGSFALGRKENGHLVPDHKGDMPIPSFIPEGSVVSMTEVRP